MTNYEYIKQNKKELTSRGILSSRSIYYFDWYEKFIIERTNFDTDWKAMQSLSEKGLSIRTVIRLKKFMEYAY